MPHPPIRRFNEGLQPASCLTAITSQEAQDRVLVDEWVTRVTPDERPVMAVLPVLRILDEASTHGVACEVSLLLKQVITTFDRNVVEAGLPKRARAAVFLVEPAGVLTVESLKAAAERGFRELDDYVVVRAEHRVAEAYPSALLNLEPKEVQEAVPMTVVGECFRPSNGFRVDVVHAANEFEARWSRHVHESAAAFDVAPLSVES